jgi:mono/diheme cytochrome c family protein
MLAAVMTRPSLRMLLSLAIVGAALPASGCGTSGVEVASNDPTYKGAEIFQERCGGCHTFDFAGTEGSATKVNSREYKDGPNFNQRKEKYDDVLYAIRNGGFSSGPMPQNIVTGREAELVACFVASYSGREAPRTPDPGNAPVTGSGEDDCKQQLASR